MHVVIIIKVKYSTSASNLISSLWKAIVAATETRFMWGLTFSPICFSCEGRSSRVNGRKSRCISASMTNGQNSESKSPVTSHVFETQEWKDIHGKTKQKKKKQRETWREKKGWQLQGQEGRAETVVEGREGDYKLNDTLMVNGGLRWHVPSHGMFYSTKVQCSCCCAFQPPHRCSSDLSSGCFYFFILTDVAEVHSFSLKFDDESSCPGNLLFSEPVGKSAPSQPTQHRIMLV